MLVFWWAAVLCCVCREDCWDKRKYCIKVSLVILGLLTFILCIVAVLVLVAVIGFSGSCKAIQRVNNGEVKQVIADLGLTIDQKFQDLVDYCMNMNNDGSLGRYVGETVQAKTTYNTLESFYNGMQAYKNFDEKDDGTSSTLASVER